VSVSGEDLALVVASHGRDEEAALTAALLEGVPYVGLVASPRRGAAVRAALDVPEELKSHLHTPAGLDIHARTPAEIALSILAEIVSERRSGAPRGTPVTEIGVEVPASGPGGGECCHGGHG
jgi:xanthine dehydrogenase accessory factor